MRSFSVKPRLLLIELHHLGDAVLSLPFVRGAGSDFEVHVLCRPAARPVYELLENPPTIHEWLPPWASETVHSPLQSLFAARSKGRELRPLAFAATTCAWADPRTTLLAEATASPRRIGFPTNRTNFYAPDSPWRARRLILGGLLEKFLPRLTSPLQANPDHPHLQRWNQIATALGVACDFTLPWIKTLPAPPERERKSKPLLAIHRHARLPTKQWPLEKWEALLATESIHSRFDIVEIAPTGPVTLSAVETPDIPSLAAVLCACDALLCHDSFPAHLAAALGKPVVSLFGSGEPRWFAPYNSAHRVVQSRVCPLHPCIDRCGMSSYICLEEITPAQILRQLELLSFT